MTTGSEALDFGRMAKSVAARFRGRSDHEDLVQEAALRMLEIQAGGRVREDAPVRQQAGYYRLAAKRHLWRVMAREFAGKAQAQPFEADRIPALEPSPEATVLAEDAVRRTLDALQAGIEALPPKLRRYARCRFGLDHGTPGYVSRYGRGQVVDRLESVLPPDGLLCREHLWLWLTDEAE